jgi:multidrug transporter EmrE-like cation transporter
MMAAMQNLPPATAYARLHTGFGLLLCAALAVYMLSRDMKPT